jgi:hypothetical protein
VDEEPDLYIFRPEDPGDEWRAERERQRVESRRLHLDHLVEVLAIADACTDESRARAEAVLDGIFLVRHRESDEPCSCGCHPQLADSDFHGYGSECPCRQTSEEAAAWWDAWQTESDAYWASDEGRAIRAAQEAEEAELAEWVSTQPGVRITSHGGFAPEQWRGHVDGRSFYFRERHGRWRIELDLIPNGHFVEAYRGGDLDDPSSREMKELESGTIIAEGVPSVPGYGETSVERARFLVGTIRAHLRQQTCTVHTELRSDLELLLGAALACCPACGVSVEQGP